MGTNYYLETSVCKHCGRGGQKLHIGKSSVGWVFSLHIYPDRNINDLEDFIPLFEADGSKIIDEYGHAITPAEMRSCIMARWHSRRNEDAWFASNQAERGPMNLARSRIDGYRVIKHGAGTWTCYTGTGEEDSW